MVTFPCAVLVERNAATARKIDLDDRPRDPDRINPGPFRLRSKTLGNDDDTDRTDNFQSRVGLKRTGSLHSLRFSPIWYCKHTD